jgi:hypothetical protein
MITAAIARHADIDTRRAMGCPPRKLDPSWKNFKPRGFNEELFLYYPDEKKLVYYEIAMYNYLYYEIITEIIPGPDHENNEWITLEGSRTRSVVHCDTRSAHHDVKTRGECFSIAGRPVFVT